MTTKDSPWAEHKDELLGFCWGCRVTYAQLKDALPRMTDITPEQGEDLLGIAAQILKLQ